MYVKSCAVWPNGYLSSSAGKAEESLITEINAVRIEGLTGVVGSE
jgi:hypothetical protein